MRRNHKTLRPPLSPGKTQPRRGGTERPTATALYETSQVQARQGPAAAEAQARASTVNGEPSSNAEAGLGSSADSATAPMTRNEPS